MKVLGIFKRVFLFVLGIFTVELLLASTSTDIVSFPLPLDFYQCKESAIGEMSLWQTLVFRVKESPFNLLSTLIFLFAVLHTFIAPKFSAIAKSIEAKHALNPKMINGKIQVSFIGEMCHFLGEIEAIFGIWAVPLVILIACLFGTGAVTHYFNDVVNFTEPIFVVVIMAIASTRPVLKLAESLLKVIAKIGKCSVKAWWVTILIVAPIFGSFITEPAAMTIAAMLLARQFYILEPSENLRYATIGLLFVNVSIGGTLTHFAAPPILMVAHKWGWTMSYVFSQFGSHAALAIIISTCLYLFVFRKEFKSLQVLADNRAADKSTMLSVAHIPLWVIAVHTFFLAWTVINLHSPSLVIGGLLFFIAFTKSTSHYQYDVSIKSPLLVGFFLAGLVVHGGLQQWWIAPVLSSLNKATLFVGSTILTAFNDNAAITYLASLVPDFLNNHDLQRAVVSGAVTGGGLTLIANAPNPAGQSVLSKYFPGGISAVKLFIAAIVPTIIAGICLNLY